MRPRIIGLILDTLTKEYNSGACDDMTIDKQELVLEELKRAYSLLTGMQEKTYTTEEASLYLNVTRQTINNYVKLDKLHPIKLKGGVLLFSKKELDKLIKK